MNEIKYQFEKDLIAKRSKRIKVIFLALLTIVFSGALMQNRNYYGAFLTANLFGQENPIMKVENRAELKAELIGFFPREPKAGDNLQIKIKVENNGNLDAEKLKIKLLDENGWGKTQNIAVKKHLYRYVDFSLPILEQHKSKHNFQVIVDAKNEVKENNKQNNILSFSLEIK